MIRLPRRTPRPNSHHLATARSTRPSAPKNVAPPVSGLALWLDASANPAADGSAVASWPDLSGQGRNATAGGIGPAPTYQASAFASGLGGVLFPQRSELILGGPSLVLSGPAALFCVVDRLPGSSFYALNPRSDQPNYPGLSLLSSGQVAACDDDANYGLIAYAGTGPLLLRWLRDGSGWTFRGTGMAADAILPAGGVSGNPPAATGPITVQSLVHRQTVPQDGGDDCLAELMLFDQGVSPSDRQALETYLVAKWGVVA